MNRTLKRFWTDDRGNIAIIFGLAIIPFMIAAGTAVDYGRAVVAKHRLQWAMDSAVLAAGSLRTATEDERKALGKAIFEANFPPSEYGLTVGADFITINNNVVSADETTAVDTTLMRLASVYNPLEELDVQADSTALVPQVGNAEISLVLDYSGSMGNYLNGSPKYETMRDAAVDLINSVSQDGDHEGVSFSLIPFHSGVYANLMGNHLTDSSYDKLSGTSRHWSCVGDRKKNNTSDTEPSTGKRHRWQQDEMYRWSGSSNYATYCSTGLPVTELTNDISSLTSLLSGWVPASCNACFTAISTGFSFGWHSISPNTVFDNGSSYELITSQDPEERVIKAIVLLTDGAQTASAHRESSNGGTGYSPSGDNDWPLSQNNGEQNLEDLCTNAKAKDIIVVTVAFDLNDQDTIDRLHDCASAKTDGTGNYAYQADSTSELAQAFEDIGTVLTEMVYLSQ
ncbi:MAG: pilus assembly protein [Pseudomonadota bacterium]